MVITELFWDSFVDFWIALEFLGLYGAVLACVLLWVYVGSCGAVADCLGLYGVALGVLELVEK